MSAILLRNRSASYHGARHRLWPLAALLPFLLLAACTSPEQKEAQHLERAIALYEEGEDAKAMVELRNVLQLNGKNADALYHVGLIHERNNRLQPALAAFQKAASERPGLVPAHLKGGIYALGSGDLDTAARAAAAIEEAEPASPDALILKGSGGAAQGRHPGGS